MIKIIRLTTTLLMCGFICYFVPSINAAINAADCPSGAICDDFEMQASSSPSGQWSVVSPDCNGVGTVEIDSSFAHTGEKSLKVNGSGGFCNHVFAELAGVDGLTGDDLYVRFYIYHDTLLPIGHTAFLTMQDENDGGKDLRMGGQNAVLQWNRESDDATIPVQSPAGTSQVPLLPVNEWHCLEFRVDQAAGGLQLWMDDVELDGMRFDDGATADIDSQWASDWVPDISNLRLGWEDYGGGPDTLWFDDVVVHNAPIGCDIVAVTPTPTITPGGPTPVPTDTPVPTELPPAEMHVEAFVSKQVDQQNGGVREMNINLRVFNDSSADYNDVTTRIWFDFSEVGVTSIDSNANYTGCMNGGSNGVLSGPIEVADGLAYFEIAYPSVPANSSCEGQIRIFKSDFQPPFNDDGNDWSLIGMSEGDHEETDRVTLYQSDVLVYGSEPDSLSPAVTNTPIPVNPTDTPAPIVDPTDTPILIITPSTTPDTPLTVDFSQSSSRSVGSVLPLGVGIMFSLFLLFSLIGGAAVLINKQ